MHFSLMPARLLHPSPHLCLSNHDALCLANSCVVFLVSSWHYRCSSTVLVLESCCLPFSVCVLTILVCFLLLLVPTVSDQSILWQYHFEFCLSMIYPVISSEIYYVLCLRQCNINNSQMQNIPFTLNYYMYFNFIVIMACICTIVYWTDAYLSSFEETTVQPFHFSITYEFF